MERCRALQGGKLEASRALPHAPVPGFSGSHSATSASPTCWTLGHRDAWTLSAYHDPSGHGAVRPTTC